MKRILLLLLTLVMLIACTAGCSGKLNAPKPTPVVESKPLYTGENLQAPVAETAAEAPVEPAAEIPAEPAAEAPAAEAPADPAAETLEEAIAQAPEAPAVEAAEEPVADALAEAVAQAPEAPEAEAPADAGEDVKEPAAAAAPEAPVEPAAEIPSEPVAAAPAPAINPLTGEPSVEGATEMRPYAVMINNISVAQPHVGVAKADMIWELMDEGGITRCMALFTDMANVEKVGSIRSARWYNVSVAQAFDMIFVHAGGSDEALGYIDTDGINDVDFVRGRYTGNTFYRDPNRQAHGVEHSLFAGGADIVQSAADMGYPDKHSEGYDGTYGLSFIENAADQCTADATQIHITYAGGKTTDFTYDPALGLYTMEQYGSTYADNGEEVVYFKNVLILNADTQLQADGLHLSIAMEGGSDGYFCCGGKYIPITWTRDGYNDSFHFFTADGAPLSLGIGKTFVAVQQTGGYTGTTEFVA